MNQYVLVLMLFTRHIRNYAEWSEGEVFYPLNLTNINFNLYNYMLYYQHTCYSLDQTSYINTILNRFNTSECKQSGTPMDTDIKLEKLDKKSENC